MEPEDNFTLINSYNIEESQPRQLPKAVSCNKVTPTPLVPDVSLVFDSKQNDLRMCTSNPEPLHEERLNSSKCDNNGPRRVKPIPIAPFPNETYAAWRTRAQNAQSSISSRVPEVAFKSAALKSHSNNTKERFSAETGLRETLSLLPYGKDLNPQNTDHWAVTQTLENSNHGNLNERILNHDIRERIIESNRSSFRKESIPEICELQTNHNSSKNKPIKSNSFQETARYHVNPTSTLINREEENSVGLSNEYQSFKSHQELMKEKQGYNTFPVKQNENSSQIGQARVQKEPIDGINGPDRWSESSVTAKDEGSTKKRDALRDLHRIVLLQNEQLKSLQAQVEKLLKKDAVESYRHAPGKGPVIRCVEEGTQTISDTVRVSSVGVMTSFINSNNVYSGVAGGVSSADSNPNCNCKGCPCSSANRETMTKARVSQKCDAPRSSVRNVRKMHQVIEEESDESSSSLKGDRAPQNRDKNHQISKSKDLQGNGSRGSMPDLNKPLSNDSKTSRSSMRGGSSDGGKVERGSSNSVAGSRDGKNIQERNRQNLKPLEAQKYYPDHSSGNRKAIVSKNRQNDDEMTMTLNGVDLQTVTEPQLSPEPSIHVDIQDYQEFSGEVDVTSDDDSYYSENDDSSSESGEGENAENLENRQMNTSPAENEAGNQERQNANTKVGWTFYNNVLGQVNKLLENQEPTHIPPPPTMGENQDVNSWPQQPVAHPVVSPGRTSCVPSSRPQLQHPDPISQKVMPSMEVVREATLQHLRQLGIDLSSDQDENRFLAPMASNNVPNPGGRDFHDSRRVTFDPKSNRGRSVGERRPMDTSLRMQSLALKYLSDEQLARCGYMNLRHGSQPEPPKVSEQPPNLAQGLIGEMSAADFTLYGMNGTNLSFSTLRYLQRYHLLPSNGTGPAGIWRHQDGNQQANFIEAANARGADLGNTRSPGQIDYTHDYMEGFRQGANMALGLNGLGEKAHSSTPANKIDPVTPNAKMAHAEKETYFHRKEGDLPYNDRDPHCGGNQMGYSEKKVVKSKQRSKGKQRGQQVPKSKNGCERNRNQNPNPPEKVDVERFHHDNILRGSEPKRRVHVDSPKSSNILDITALRQQPKLL